MFTFAKANLTLTWVFISLFFIESTLAQPNLPPFSSFDINGDGAISPAEFVETQNAQKKLNKGMKGLRGQSMSFISFDSNGDNIISPGEYEQVQRPNLLQNPRNIPSFSDFDSNGDGVLKRQEFYDARAKRMTERAKNGYPMKNLKNAPSFDMIDKDGDGNVNSKEFLVFQNQHHQPNKK